MSHPETDDDIDFDEEDDCEFDCISCCGEGYVDNVAEKSGRYDWDTDGPGPCPNCGGSGNRKDQKWW